MKLSELTDDAISGWIAEKLEPLDETLSNHDGYYYGKLWEFDRVKGWQPRNFINDPAMTVMLMEKMPEPDLWLESAATDAIKLWGCCADINDRLLVSFAKTIGRAVAEAWMLANGWKEGE